MLQILESELILLHDSLLEAQILFQRILPWAGECPDSAFYLFYVIVPIIFSIVCLVNKV